MERDVDALMQRTRMRPLPQGEIKPVIALILGLYLVLLGVLSLYIWVNFITAFFALLAMLIYNFVYTPMKKISWWNTLIGSIPGALPPLWGWTAVTGQANTGAWILFLILVFWQQAHFFTIAWVLKDDYKRANLKMLPVIDPSGSGTFRQILMFALLLIPVSLLPVTMQMAGEIYFWGALVLGLTFFLLAVRLVLEPSVKEARTLILASVVYLPLLLGLILGDRLV